MPVPPQAQVQILPSCSLDSQSKRNALMWLAAACPSYAPQQYQGGQQWNGFASYSDSRHSWPQPSGRRLRWPATRMTVWESILFTNTTDRLHSILHFRPLPASTSGSGQPQGTCAARRWLPPVPNTYRNDQRNLHRMIICIYINSAFITAGPAAINKILAWEAIRDRIRRAVHS